MFLIGNHIEWNHNLYSYDLQLQTIHLYCKHVPCCTRACKSIFWMHPTRQPYATTCPCMCAHAHAQYPPPNAPMDRLCYFYLNYLIMSYCPCHVVTLTPCLPPPPSFPHRAHLLHLQSVVFHICSSFFCQSKAIDYGDSGIHIQEWKVAYIWDAHAGYCIPVREVVQSLQSS